MKQSTCGAVICQPSGGELKHDISFKISPLELSYKSNIFFSFGMLKLLSTPWNTHLRIQNPLYTVNTTIHCEKWSAKPETLWQMISCFIKHNCVHRSPKRNNKKNNENHSFEKLSYCYS